MKKTINQTNLVPITFGVSISKEKNSKKVTTKQNGARQRNTHVKVLMDSGASVSIIHESYVNKNNFITMETFANKQSRIAESFSTSRKAEITLKMPKHNVTAHISTPFQVITKIMVQFLIKIYFSNQESNQISKIVSQDSKISNSL